MKATSLSDLKEITIRQEGNSSQGVVHSLSGPDHIGTIAYIENHMELVSSKHKLKTINIDGKNDEVIFSRSGDALWDHVAGNFLALSPIGGFVALICNVKDCDIGTLEIWDIKKKKNLDVKLPAFNAPLSWFPDGTMLAYTGVRNQNGKNMSSIFIYDLKENKNNFFANGEGALVSPDGKSIIIGQADHSLALFNYKTKVSRTLKIPGLVGFPMGFANNNRILAFCLPTKGGPAQWTKNNSPLVGAKPIIAIKIIDLETGEFQTVLNSVDPRREVSSGKTIKD
jgi:WD40 repeat protein